jgi:D-tyrosyl-tRNA(Tyr) deacylase
MTRVVAQRVNSASVTVDAAVVGAIERGLVLLVGIREGDDEAAVERVADKVAVMRIFEDEAGKMNLSTADVGGAMLAISQFTLFADLRKGRRPSFIHAAGPDEGLRLYEHFCTRLASHGYVVERGRFGAHMEVSLINNGPVTIVLDSNEL